MEMYCSFATVYVINGFGVPKPSGIECGGETERPQFQLNLPYLGKNKHKLTAEHEEVIKVRTITKKVKGIYRKRVTGTRQASLKKYEASLDASETSKLKLKCFIY